MRADDRTRVHEDFLAERIGVVADAAYYSLLALTLLGVVLLGRSFWATRLGRALATSFLTALVLYGFVYYGNYRYRLPYEPLMIVVAATLVTRLWRSRRTISSPDFHDSADLEDPQVVEDDEDERVTSDREIRDLT